MAADAGRRCRQGSAAARLEATSRRPALAAKKRAGQATRTSSAAPTPGPPRPSSRRRRRQDAWLRVRPAPPACPARSARSAGDPRPHGRPTRSQPRPSQDDGRSQRARSQVSATATGWLCADSPTPTAETSSPPCSRARVPPTARRPSRRSRKADFASQIRLPLISPVAGPSTLPQGLRRAVQRSRRGPSRRVRTGGSYTRPSLR